MKQSQLRLIISGVAMFLFFGLIPSIPDIHYNKSWFPGTRNMYTLHVEATQNGMMLILMSFLLPWLHLSKSLLIIFEISAHIGAWFNVFPWIYGAIYGTVLKFGEGQVAGNHLADVPPDNDYHVGNMVIMLKLCTVGDIVAWSIAFCSLCYFYSFRKID